MKVLDLTIKSFENRTFNGCFYSVFSVTWVFFLYFFVRLEDESNLNWIDGSKSVGKPHSSAMIRLIHRAIIVANYSHFSKAFEYLFYITFHRISVGQKFIQALQLSL